MSNEAAPAAEAAASEAAPAQEQPASQETPPPSFIENGTFSQAYLDQFPSEKVGIFNKYQNDPVKIGNALIESQSMIGRRLEIPNESTPDEVRQEFRSRNGIPIEADGYNPTLPEGMEDQLPAIKERWAEAWHKAELTPNQVQILMGQYLELAGSDGEAAEALTEANRINSLEEAKNLLFQEWGNDFDRNKDMARRIAQSGTHPLNPDKINDPDIALFLAGLGESLSTQIGEDQLHGVQGFAETQQSPGIQAKDIMTNPNNALYQAYQQGDPAARTRVRQLNQKQAQIDLRKNRL